MEKAVVSSEVGGAGEMITHGETGYLIPVDDVSRLTETMRMLRAAPEKVREVGLRARKKIINDLGIEAMAARTHQVYLSLIESKGKKSSGAGDQGRLREQLAMISAK